MKYLVIVCLLAMLSACADFQSSNPYLSGLPENAQTALIQYERYKSEENHIADSSDTADEFFERMVDFQANSVSQQHEMLGLAHAYTGLENDSAKAQFVSAYEYVERKSALCQIDTWVRFGWIGEEEAVAFRDDSEIRIPEPPFELLADLL